MSWLFLSFTLVSNVFTVTCSQYISCIELLQYIMYKAIIIIYIAAIIVLISYHSVRLEQLTTDAYPVCVGVAIVITTCCMH